MTARLAQWHEDPRLVAFSAGGTGRVLVWLVAGALLGWHSLFGYRVVASMLGVVFVVMVLVTLWPERRRLLVSAGSVVGVLAVFQRRNLPGLAWLAPATWPRPGAAWLNFTVLAGGVLLGLALCLRLVAAWPAWPAALKRFPVLALHACAWGVLGLTLVAPPLAVVAELVPFVLWRLSYLLQYVARHPSAGARWRDHFFYLWPMAGVDRPVPIGKGLDYLARHEARSPAELAGAQLAGIKLLGLALAWTVAGWCVDAGVYGDPRSPAWAWLGGASPRLPALQDMIESHRSGLLEGVASMYLQLIRDTLRLAVAGHVLVGCMRLIGFRIFRDVYRPLLAPTVLEFWNRRTWYFKELVTEFFFYPTYLRANWAGPRTRLFLAVFAAAGFGNLYYHALISVDTSLAEHRALLGSSIVSHAVYSTLLAISIWVSMLRQQAGRRRGALRPTRWGRVRGILGVWTLYAVIHVFSGNLGATGPLERLDWLLGLLG